MTYSIVARDPGTGELGVAVHHVPEPVAPLIDALVAQEVPA